MKSLPAVALFLLLAGSTAQAAEQTLNAEDGTCSFQVPGDWRIEPPTDDSRAKGITQSQAFAPPNPKSPLVANIILGIIKYDGTLPTFVEGLRKKLETDLPGYAQLSLAPFATQEKLSGLKLACESRHRAVEMRQSLYAFQLGNYVYLLTATAAKGDAERFGPAFDRAAQTLAVHTEKPRLVAANGSYALQIPSGWRLVPAPIAAQRRGNQDKAAAAPKLPGSTFTANMFVTQESFAGSIAEFLEAVRKGAKSAISTTEDVSAADFVTNNKLAGRRIVQNVVTGESKVRMYLYVFDHDDSMFVATGSAPREGFERYEPLFDAAVKTFMVRGGK